MHRFSFRSPPAHGEKKKNSKNAKEPATTSGSHYVEKRSLSPLRLFASTIRRRRPSQVPSLDDLVSPDRLALDSPITSDGGESRRDDEEEQGQVEEAEDEVEDERGRLQRAKARAFTRPAAAVSMAPVASVASPFYSDEEADDTEDLSTDVLVLQSQVWELVHEREQLESAWRRENDQLRERLAHAQRRIDELQGRSMNSEDKPTKRPTDRERELLRLLVRIVGKDQIRGLLANTGSTNATQAAEASAPTEMRRRLLTRAAAAAAAQRTTRRNSTSNTNNSKRTNATKPSKTKASSTK